MRLPRAERVSVANGFPHSAGTSAYTLITFPLPAHRTRGADFPHWALAPGHANLDRSAFPTALQPAAREARVFPESASASGPASDAPAVSPSSMLTTAASGNPELA